MDKEPENKIKEVPVRDSKVKVWGPIYITLNLEKSSSKAEVTHDSPTTSDESEPSENPVEEETINTEEEDQKINILTPVSENNQNKITPSKKTLTKEVNEKPANNKNSKKVTYVYNLIDHGLNCECIDVKGELLIRSALPVYRKINQGVEFEQITNNQIKLIITSRVLEGYQEVFQGFSIPKATFRIWILGYKFA